MKEFIVVFNNGSWEDTVSFKIKAFSKNEALNKVLNENPEYSVWKNYIYSQISFSK